MVRQASSRDRRRAARWVGVVFLAVVAAYAIGIRSYNLAEPWGRHLLGINGAWHSIIARNLLRYGFGATQGAPVINTGWIEPEGWRRYLHHPPLLDWLVAGAFRAGGERESSARLVALVFSLAGLVWVGRLARRLYDGPTALAAFFLMGAMPMSAIYGMHVDFPGPVALFFAIAAFSSYERFLADGHPRHAKAMLLWLTGCCLTDWGGFYIAPLLVLHQRLVPRTRRSVWVWWSLGYSVLLLGVILGWIWLVSGELGFLFHQLQVRTFSLAVTRERTFTVAQWVRTVGQYLWQLYTPVVLLAVIVWMIHDFWRRWRRSATVAESFLWLLLGFGLVNLLIPFQGAYVHDPLCLFLAPGLAVAGGRVTSLAGAWLTRRDVPQGLRWLAAAMLVVALAIWFARVSVEYPQSRRRGPDAAYGYTAQQLGRAIARQARPDEAVVLLDGEGCMPAVWYYADRPLAPFVASVADLERAREEAEVYGPECFATPARLPAAMAIIPRQFVARYQAVVDHLESSYPKTEDGPFLVYDLRRPTNAIRSPP